MPYEDDAKEFINELNAQGANDQQRAEAINEKLGDLEELEKDLEARLESNAKAGPLSQTELDEKEDLENAIEILKDNLPGAYMEESDSKYPDL